MIYILSEQRIHDNLFIRSIPCYTEQPRERAASERVTRSVRCDPLERRETTDSYVRMDPRSLLPFLTVYRRNFYRLVSLIGVRFVSSRGTLNAAHSIASTVITTISK